MICPYPIQVGLGPVPCGQCMNCRINRKRQWMGKLMLEWAVQPHSVFLTLTYNDENVPIKDGLDVLYKKDLQNFHKQLRYRYGKIRYYSVGEYGDKFKRPHYHSIMFTKECWMNKQEEISRIWNKGHVHLGETTEASIGYVAQYCCKKMTSRKDERRDGRPKEFSLSSTRPGIGAPAIKGIVKAYKKVWKTVIENGDINPTFRIAGREYPWDRLIADKIREELGIPTIPHLRPSNGDVPFDFQLEEAKLMEQKLKRKYYRRKK